MELQKIDGEFTVCKIASTQQIDLTQEYVFLSKTLDEISLVCKAEHAPSDAVAAEPGWKALKVSGVLDFGMIGVLAKISNILAEAEISIFVISTYNTDYILVKAEGLERATRVLTHKGYTIR